MTNDLHLLLLIHTLLAVPEGLLEHRFFERHVGIRCGYGYELRRRLPNRGSIMFQSVPIKRSNCAVSLQMAESGCGRRCKVL